MRVPKFFRNVKILQDLLILETFQCNFWIYHPQELSWSKFQVPRLFRTDFINRNVISQCRDFRAQTPRGPILENALISEPLDLEGSNFQKNFVLLIPTTD